MAAPREGAAPRTPMTMVRQLQAAATAGGDGNEADIHGAEKGTLQVEGITTASITFQATVDGSTWVAIEDVEGDTTAAADGLFFFDRLAGVRSFRAQITSFTSGTINVWLSAWS